MGKNEKSSTILIVDDVRENIDLLRETLSDYHCLIALDGPTALQIANGPKKPDLIILDILMPDMDGYEVLQELKKNERTAKIPVIFLTGKKHETDEVRGLELGAVDYITKPINPYIVRARVKTHLSLKAALEKVENQNKELMEMAKIKEDVENITRHDLKSPLTAVIGNVSLLLEMEKCEEKLTKRILQNTLRAAYRILDMVNRTLDLYKMEKGIYKVNYEPVNIVELLNNLFEELNRSFGYKNFKAEIFVNNHPVKEKEFFIIEGEPFLFYSLFMNLITNAIEASPQNGVVRVYLESNGGAVVKICNQGVVPPEVRERFFEKFTTSGKRHGTGLGTYSAKLITQTMGGEIKMQTSEEEGTIVTVHLPKKRQLPA